MSYEWLEKLKPGDTVARQDSWASPCLLVVAKIHKLHVVTENGRKWRKDTGYSAGQNSGRIVEFTLEIQEKIERHQLERWLSVYATNVSRRKIVPTLETLRALRELGGGE